MGKPDFPHSILEFQARFVDERSCMDYLFACRWPDGFVCPRCNGTAWSGTKWWNSRGPVAVPPRSPSRGLTWDLPLPCLCSIPAFAQPGPCNSPAGTACTEPAGISFALIGRGQTPEPTQFIRATIGVCVKHPSLVAVSGATCSSLHSLANSVGLSHPSTGVTRSRKIPFPWNVPTVPDR